jgi:hypothetical protein
VLYYIHVKSKPEVRIVIVRCIDLEI